MSPLRLNGSTSGYSQLDAPAIAGDQTFTLPGTGGTIDRLNRAGNILQVVSASYSTTVTTTALTFVDTGLTATITPSSATSKILVLVSQWFTISASPGAANNTEVAAVGSLQVLQGATVIFNSADVSNLGTYSYGLTTNGNQADTGIASPSLVSSPATTSAVTYKTRARHTGHTPSPSLTLNIGGSFITLMEIAG